MNSKEFSKVMRRLGKIPEIANRKIAADLNAEIQRNFDAGKDANRKPFKRLSKSYLKRRRFPSKPILTQTEAGRKSVRVTAYGGKLTARIGVNYMVMHQLGGDVLPRRAPLPMNKTPKAWNEIMMFRYEEAARKITRNA